MTAVTASGEGSERAGHEELEALVLDYRHLREEHRRTGPNGRVRRKLEHRLEAVADRFERRLRQAVSDEPLRAQWRDHFYHAAPPPAGGAPLAPILFRGRSEAGSELLVRRSAAGELEATVDGAAVERLAGADELLSEAPHLTFDVGGRLYRETFSLPAGGLAELERAVATGKPVPGLAALRREGLIGRDLELTSRGRRALAVPHGHAAAGAAVPVEIVARGPVGERARTRLRTALSRIVAGAPRPVVSARGTLLQEENPSLGRPAVAEASVTFAGRVARARARAGELTEAIDLLVERLERTMRELRRREASARREPGLPAPGRWRHGSLPSHPHRPWFRRR